jgi:AcrR family transcriptional regulator
VAIPETTTATRPSDGRRQRWSEHRALRRAALVAAGVLAIDRYGADASADQIAEVAGVSRTVLYRYFRDKQDLQLAIAQQMVEVVVASLAPPLKSGSTANEIIRGTVRVVVGWLDEHPNLYQFLHTQDRGGDALEAVEITMADQVAGVLKAFIMWFGLDADVAEPGAYALVGMVEAASTWLLKRKPEDRDKYIDFICRAVWNVIDGALRDQGLQLDPDSPLPRDVLEAEEST